ncbi:c-type cytochrome [Aureispira anguillae]|uniref:Cytochrome c n=1 Tax=Aureispira anguillae TaxID=2864201 RepID=A0A916DVK1_9BACT|nr:cytochrome c [Aureispira anguillae]BDS13812.1 cytochrome c [Aureispira anguillae]
MRIISVLVILSFFLWNCTSCESSPKEVSGVEIYKTRCLVCHGTDGKMGMNGAKDLSSSPLNVAQRIEVVTNGKNIMPKFKGIMSEEEIKAVVEFTMTLK